MTRNRTPDRLQRLLMLALGLQFRGMTRKSLSEAFSVSEKMITHDLNLLKKSGIRVDYDRKFGIRTWIPGRFHAGLSQLLDGHPVGDQPPISYSTKKLRQVIRLRGQSYQSLAAKLGITRQAVHIQCSGRNREMLEGTLHRYADALDMPPDMLRDQIRVRVPKPTENGPGYQPDPFR